jgi:hypothetical protein
MFESGGEYKQCLLGKLFQDSRKRKDLPAAISYSCRMDSFGKSPDPLLRSPEATVGKDCFLVALGHLFETQKAIIERQRAIRG